MAKKKSSMEEGEVEANLLPVMNVMFLLIPALLLAREVARFAAVVVTPRVLICLQAAGQIPYCHLEAE